MMGMGIIGGRCGEVEPTKTWGMGSSVKDVRVWCQYDAAHGLVRYGEIDQERGFHVPIHA